MSNFILSPRGDTLMILKTKQSDSGAYSCLVKNLAGEIGTFFKKFLEIFLEATFSVMVLTPPHIEQLIDQNPRVINNKSVIMECPMMGYPAPQVIWFKDNQILDFNNNTNIKIEPPNNLKIDIVTVKNFGYKIFLTFNI